MVEDVVCFAKSKHRAAAPAIRRTQWFHVGAYGNYRQNYLPTNILEKGLKYWIRGIALKGELTSVLEKHRDHRLRLNDGWASLQSPQVST